VNQRLLSRLLEERGHTVVVAQNGEEALQALQKQSFEVVLDGQMPEMDGFEVTKKIRGAEKASGNHVPIIALIAHAMQCDKERFLACGWTATFQSGKNSSPSSRMWFPISIATQKPKT
jgi:two-component system sensor histidine kinase/response regulator